MRTALLFGSFNPVHYGHLMLAQYVLNFADVSDVWLVVSPHNPFKNPHELAPAQQRVEMARLATQGNQSIRVSDIELQMPSPSYTIRTIERLQADYPGREFAIIMGADNLPALPSWREADKLLRGRQIIVYPRPGFANDNKQVTQLGASLTLLDAPQVDISSTMLRNWISKDIDIRNFTNPSVVDYIKLNNLYRN